MRRPRAAVKRREEMFLEQANCCSISRMSQPLLAFISIGEIE